MNWWEKWFRITAYVAMTLLTVVAWILMFIIIGYIGIFIYEAL